MKWWEWHEQLEGSMLGQEKNCVAEMSIKQK